MTRDDILTKVRGLCDTLEEETMISVFAGKVDAELRYATTIDEMFRNLLRRGTLPSDLEVQTMIALMVLLLQAKNT